MRVPRSHLSSGPTTWFLRSAFGTPSHFGNAGWPWYYDNFSDDVQDSCGIEGIPNSGRRIAFTANAEPPALSTIRFDCQPPVFNSDPGARGAEAAGTLCPDGTGSGPASCGELSDDTYNLVCVPTLGLCQIACSIDPECPGSSVCQADEGVEAGGYCVNPTCPPL